MKASRVGFAVLAGASLLLLAGGRPQAFHSGGVAECAGCHSMHEPKSTSYLLVGTDRGSTCLSCHQNSGDTGPSSYHVSTIDSKLGAGLAPLQRGPGGDFGWIKKDYNWSATTPELGETHGHNIVAGDFSYLADTTNTTAPGGTFVSANLTCTSCHDPHGGVRRKSDGNYATGRTMGTASDVIIGSGSYDNSPIPAAGESVGAYRLLRGLGDNSQGVTFSGVAIAVAPATYNRTEAATQTRVAYGAQGANTWGNWCATCHPDMHSDAKYVHPIDETLGSTVAGNYNYYVKSGDLTGNATTSYLSLVPFAEGTGTISTLASHAKINDSYLQGPVSNDKVMCLSCHRAHASGMMYGLRFDIEYEFMTKGSQYIGSDNPLVTGSRAANQHRGRTNAEWQAAYYDRPATKWASYQRVLCNKCHAKD
jgi:predicted CXXCH cytochrome family protein